MDPGHTAVSSVVGRQQIESLPINGRNFISFSVITPGVTTNAHAAARRDHDQRPVVHRSARPLQQRYIFGRGAFPSEPQRDEQERVTFGRFEQALPPRQVQLALRVSF